MSVAYVVLRFEIADSSPLLPSLHFSVPNYQFKQEEPDTDIVTSNVRDEPYSEEFIERFRGFREFQSITIATLTKEDIKTEIQMADKKEDTEKTNQEYQNKQKTASQNDVDEVDGTAMNIKKETSVDSAESRLKGAASDDKKSVTYSYAESVSRQSSKDRQSMSPTYESAAYEYRFSPVSEDGSSSRPNSASGGRKRVKSHSPTAKIPQNVHFFSGNPSVEITEGILHLYKDTQRVGSAEEDGRGQMLSMLAVPASMMVKDLLQFLAPVYKWIEQLKIIRDATPNQYMVLLKFQCQEYADEFYKSHNNTRFNSIEDELCRLVYVAKVETVKSSHGASLPVPGLTELPTCPVCLERMDESVDGILTILCNHSFHGSCLAQWGDTSCPVCRYIQSPIPTADNKCFQCSSTDSLWICLICGHVGCGRYVGGHARSHFEETQHTYSLQLGNNRVWDYVGDNYVHRLIQNKGDGKLVEVDEGGNIVEQDEKIDSLTLEYTYLLTSQLESQRCYFEEKMTVVEQEAHKQMEEVELRSKAMLDRCGHLEKQVADITREKQSSEKKVTQLTSRVNKLSKNLMEECELNKSLQQNQEQWQKQVASVESLLKQRDEELRDVQEQLRDVMFYLEAQQKLANTTEVTQQEIQDGHIVLGAAAQGAQGGKKRNRKR